MQWVVGSVPHGEFIELHNLCNEGHGIYSVSGMMHIKDPLLLIKKKSSPWSSPLVT